MPKIFGEAELVRRFADAFHTPGDEMPNQKSAVAEERGEILNLIQHILEHPELLSWEMRGSFKALGNEVSGNGWGCAFSVGGLSGVLSDLQARSNTRRQLEGVKSKLTKLTYRIHDGRLQVLDCGKWSRAQFVPTEDLELAAAIHGLLPAHLHDYVMANHCE